MKRTNDFGTLPHQKRRATQSSRAALVNSWEARGAFGYWTLSALKKLLFLCVFIFPPIEFLLY